MNNLKTALVALALMFPIITFSQGKGPDIYTPSPNALNLPAPINDECQDAILVTVPSTTSGSTSGGNTDATPFCGTASTSPGVWYIVEGTGSDIDASLCGAPFDSKLSIYDGSCNSLNCITGEDDDFGNCGGPHPFVSWPSQVGTTYFVHVHGFAGANGPFDLVLEGEPAPIPTLSQWGIILLFILLIIFATVTLKSSLKRDSRKLQS